MCNVLKQQQNHSPGFTKVNIWLQQKFYFKTHIYRKNKWKINISNIKRTYGYK